jgi:hypothetical protein
MGNKIPTDPSKAAVSALAIKALRESQRFLSCFKVPSFTPSFIAWWGQSACKIAPVLPHLGMLPNRGHC